ncbi:MAG TPA: DUF1684 domain-containing protein [Gaiellaceae bacterium]|nr:DUF1684 domain-containing protein [Gaiellaceae bacterium]
MTAAETLSLLDWKRRVFSLYAAVRALEPEAGWQLWRETRAELFRTHPQSPSPGYEGLVFYDYDPEARVFAELEDVEAPPQAIETSGPEPMLFKPFARAHFTLRGEQLALELDWLESYGGGVFLSFRDATSGRKSYGGGRYLLDTVKGADLGEDEGRLVLDFNFAYNPSCSYDPSWVCPLAPPANRLQIAVEAGERHTG